MMSSSCLRVSSLVGLTAPLTARAAARAPTRAAVARCPYPLLRTVGVGLALPLPCSARELLLTSSGALWGLDLPRSGLEACFGGEALPKLCAGLGWPFCGGLLLRAAAGLGSVAGEPATPPGRGILHGNIIHRAIC
jgi:hypothetical protein